MNNQFYNLSQPSKNTLEKDRKNRLAAESYLQERNERLAAKEQEKLLNEKASLMTGAYYANASSMVHSKRRTQALTEEIKYANTAPTIAMTELVAQLVESSLLFDAKEYEKYYPNYKAEIRETVANLLESASLENVDPRTEVLLQYVEETLPIAKEGKYLSEADISRLMQQDKPAVVEAAINNLTGDVSNRVTALVEKEQKRVDKINQELDKSGVQDKIEKTENTEMPVADEPNNDVPQENENRKTEAIAMAIMNGELTQEDFEKAIKEGEITPEEAEEIRNIVEAQVGESQPEEMPEETSDVPDADAQAPSEVMPQQGSGKSIHIAADGTMGITMPNGQLALNQDGSMDIQLMEKRLFKETPRSGLLESLAVNEAVNMIKEGKEYNSEACISNALLFVTITEAMSELGLLDVNDRTYADVVKRAGGTLNELVISQKVKAGDTAVGKNGVWGVIDHSGKALDPTDPKAVAIQRRRKKQLEKEEMMKQKGKWKG